MTKKEFFWLLDALEGEISIDDKVDADHNYSTCSTWYSIILYCEGRSEKRLLAMGLNARRGMASDPRYSMELMSSRTEELFKKNAQKFRNWLNEWESKKGIAMSAEKRKDNTPIFTGTETIRCAVALTDEEIKEKVDSLVEAIIEKEDIAAAKKLAVDGYNDSIKHRDAYSLEPAHILNKGTEMRDVECEVHVDHAKRMRLYLEPVTKEIMKEVAIEDDDQQMSLDE